MTWPSSWAWIRWQDSIKTTTIAIVTLDWLNILAVQMRHFYFTVLPFINMLMGYICLVFTVKGIVLITHLGIYRFCPSRAYQLYSNLMESFSNEVNDCFEKVWSQSGHWCYRWRPEKWLDGELAKADGSQMERDGISKTEYHLLF